MIPRYAREEMTSIWEPQSRFQIWFEIEAHACDALAELGAPIGAGSMLVLDEDSHVIDVIRYFLNHLLYQVTNSLISGRNSNLNCD